MSEQPKEDAGNYDMEVRAIVFNDHEKRLWDGVARILEEPIDVAFRLCALSGAEHYLSEVGVIEQAALAGMLLQSYAQSKGIEVRRQGPSMPEMQMGRKKKKPETPS